jgi:hypothetical protein
MNAAPYGLHDYGGVCCADYSEEGEDNCPKKPCEVLVYREVQVASSSIVDTHLSSPSTLVLTLSLLIHASLSCLFTECASIDMRPSGKDCQLHSRQRHRRCLWLVQFFEWSKMPPSRWL